MARMTTRWAAAAAATVCLGALLGACGDDGEPAAEETSSSTPSTAPEPSETADTSPMGKQVTLGPVTLTVPDGYRVKDVSEYLLLIVGPEQQRLGLAVQESMTDTSLDELAADPSVTWTSEPRRVDDVELDGVELYHLTGETAFGRGDEYGVDNAGYNVTINASDLIASDAERASWLEPILASLTWG